MIRNTDLAAFLAEKHKLSAADAASFVDAAFAIIADGLNLGEIVKVKGLGTFKVSETKERESIDISTGERILIGSKPKIVFTPDMVLRERVNAPFASFSSVALSDGVEIDTEPTDYNGAAEQPPTEAEEASVAEKPAAQAAKEEAEAKDETKPNAPENAAGDGGDDTEETGDGGSPLRKWIWILSVLLLLSLCCCGYLLWRMEKLAQTPMLIANGNETLQESDTATLRIQAEQTDSVRVAASAGKSGSTAAPIRPNEGTDKAERQSNSASMAAPFRPNDPRIKYGAYYIVGTQCEVVVQQGQTFGGICRAYLGDDMECYVEVLNGRRSAQAGDTILIPKLITKKAWKRKIKIKN